MSTPRRFVIGDIHGAYQPFLECLEKVSFDYKNDLLITLGDVCDGWPQVKEAIDELLKIKNLVVIYGNHDDWALHWFETGKKNRNWLQQGGHATIVSYANGVPDKHIKFLEQAKKYFILENKIFVHGGFNPLIDLSDQDKDTFIWDRSLIEKAIEMEGTDKKLTVFDEVYLGHTPTLRFGLDKPIKLSEIWMMDTGAGWSRGKLTIMDIDTKEYYQSSTVRAYYPFFNGRG